MIDWLTAVIPLPEVCRSIDCHTMAGYTLFARPGGEVEKVVDRWLPIDGTFDHKIRCRVGSSGLWISGNPTKWLTGQNVDGPEDAAALLATVASRVIAALSIPSCDGLTGARLTRVDTTQSLNLGGIERVREVLRIASLTARARHQGRSQTAYQTVYLGQHSRRHSVKLYAKGDELRQHPPHGLPPDLESTLQEHANGLLRIEVTLRRMELAGIGMDKLEAWQSPHVAHDLWQRYWSRVELHGAADLLDDEVLALPRRLRGTYELWRRGADVSELVSKATYYRHRRELLRLSGGRADIGVLRPPVQTAELACENVGGWLHTMTPWKASGHLSRWIEEMATAA